MARRVICTGTGLLLLACGGKAERESQPVDSQRWVPDREDHGGVGAELDTGGTAVSRDPGAGDAGASSSAPAPSEGNSGTGRDEGEASGSAGSSAATDGSREMPVTMELGRGAPSTRACDAFHPLFSLAHDQHVARDAWNSMQAFGEASVGERPDTACGDCVLSGDCRAAEKCHAIDACIQRHCLCTNCDPSSLPGGNVCSCIQTCIPDARSECWEPWNDFVTCGADSCKTACE